MLSIRKLRREDQGGTKTSQKYLYSILILDSYHCELSIQKYYNFEQIKRPYWGGNIRRKNLFK